MKIKVGDKVKVIAGADKGKEGNVVKTLRAENRVIVSGIHIVKKHVKPSKTNETGGILEVEAPIHASNVKVIESSKKETKTTPKKVTKEVKEVKEVKEKKTTKKTTKKEGAK